MDLEKLTADLRDAIQVGQKEVESIPDGGTCNGDHLFFRTDREVPASRGLACALEAAGCSVYKRQTTLWRGYAIFFSTGGQAARNARAVERASEVLRSRGWHRFSIFYQVD